MIRNDIGSAIGQSGAELYAGADYGQVGGRSTVDLLGRHLAGAVIGVRGQWSKLSYDFFVGADLQAAGLSDRQGDIWLQPQREFLKHGKGKDGKERRCPRDMPMKRAAGSRSPAMQYIVDSGAGSWTVAIMRNGMLHHKVFKSWKTAQPGRSPRSEQAALELARAWRDAVLAAHPEIARWRAVLRRIDVNAPAGIRLELNADGLPARWWAETPLDAGTTQRECLEFCTQAPNARPSRIYRFTRENHAARELAILVRERQLREMVARYDSQIAAAYRANRLPSGWRNAPMYGLTEHPNCWRVKLERRRQLFVQDFAFADLAGRQAALEAAQRWRDEIVVAHQPVTRRERAQKIRRNNKTGVPGVTCMLWPDGRPRQWLAKTWIAPGKILQKTFSVYRYGDEAEHLALAERQKQLAQMHGLARLHPAEEAVRTAAVRQHGAKDGTTRSKPRPRSSKAKTSPTMERSAGALR